MLSTHPSSENRANLTKDLANNGRAALSETDWQALRKICEQ
jgi:hypothetical protein